jgi:hypothetical protein
MDDLDVAYMAGLVDGEAYIGIHRMKRAKDGGHHSMPDLRR